jgi:gamma-glutamyltranspeptidase/glutathione hydrolase
MKLLRSSVIRGGWAIVLGAGLSSSVLAVGGCGRPAADSPNGPTASSAAASPGLAASATPADRAARRVPAGEARPPATALGAKGAVSSQEAHASDVGRAILERGGNAIDAAAAVGLALAVTHPSAGNLGGGGFMVVRLADGTAHALDFRETAPAKASRDMYIGKDGKPTKESLIGPKAAGIPGSVAGLGEAHRKLGRLPWKDVVAPAIRLARDGHVIDEIHAKDMATATT